MDPCDYATRALRPLVIVISIRFRVELWFQLSLGPNLYVAAKFVVSQPYLHVVALSPA